MNVLTYSFCDWFNSRPFLKLFSLLIFSYFTCFVEPKVQAAEFPSKSITTVVPYPAGGGTDITMRVIQAKLTDYFGKSVVVDNRGGGGTMIGTRLVAGSAPDGYTLGVMDPAFIINSHLSKEAKYDADKDFVPVSLISVTPLILAMPTSFPANNLQEVVAKIKSNPGKYNFGSSGSGSASHLGVEQFRNFFGLEMTHIPYKGSGPGVVALAAGEVEMMMAGSAFVPLVLDGRLKAIAVTGTKRLSSLPQVPTFAELGYPQINIQTFAAVVAPAKTPKLILDKLNEGFVTVVNQPEIRQSLEQRGQVPIGSSQQELGNFLKENTATLLKVVKDSNVKLETN